MTTDTAVGPIYDSSQRYRPFWDALSSLYRYRGLVRLLVQRELTVRYKRSVLGVAWTVLNPVLTSLVLWFVFNTLFRPRMASGYPFIVYLLSGILVVVYFQQCVPLGGGSMAANAGVLTKVYVPPIVFPLATACAGAVNFLIGLIPLMAFQLAFGTGISWKIVFVPIPLLFLLAMITGAGLVVAAYAVQYNDVVDLTNVLVVLIGYVTPTFWPLTIIPESYRRLVFLNPLASFVETFRWLEFNGAIPSWNEVAMVAASGILGLAVGIQLFVRRWPRLAAML